MEMLSLCIKKILFYNPSRAKILPLSCDCDAKVKTHYEDFTSQLLRVSVLEWVAEKERDLYIKAKNEVTKLKSF